MKIKALLIALGLSIALSGVAGAQSFSARRMAMGGVVLGGGAGGEAANVAYRAVPPMPGQETSLSLPIGLIPLLADPPVLDPHDPKFNAFRVANLIFDPPWNLTLSGPEAPSNDITVDVAQNRLAVDLGDVGKVFPEDHARTGGVSNGPSFGVGIRQFFVALAPLVHYENDMSLNQALRGALRDGQAFLPNTSYELFDNGRAQAAAGVHLGAALSLVVNGDPRKGGRGLYAGARVKLLRGLAYGDADNTAAFTTRDTLFATDPVDVRYTDHYRDAGPDGGGFGRGLDLGTVWVAGGLELGVGVNDIGTRIDWKVRESLAARDSVTGDYVQTVLGTDVPYTSTVPTTVVANAALRSGRWLLAADVIRGVNSTQAHAGAELALPLVALRAGAGLDANQMLQFSGGGGVRFGHLGVDLALATNSRNLTQERALELGAGLAFYH